MKLIAGALIIAVLLSGCSDTSEFRSKAVVSNPESYKVNSKKIETAMEIACKSLYFDLGSDVSEKTAFEFDELADLDKKYDELSYAASALVTFSKGETLGMGYAELQDKAFQMNYLLTKFCADNNYLS